MSNGRPGHWIRFAALGLSLYLAGCAGNATTPVPEPTVGTRLHGVAQVEGVDLLEIADRMRASGDIRNAVAMYHQAHLANPQSVAPLIRLGDALMELGANADAAEAYGKALALEPNDRDALLGLGVARVLLAQPQFAVTQFESALTIDDADLRAYNGLGVALDMTGDHEAAQEVYRAALEIEPNNAKILNNLGLSLALSGKTAEAVALLERVNAAPTATAVTRQNLALAYGLSGRLQAAERVARIDLRGPAVERNLAFYAAHQEATPGNDTLARTLGVRRNGVHYVASRPMATDGAADVAPTTPAPATEPQPARATPDAQAAELAATGAPVALLPYALEHPAGGEPGEAQIAQRMGDATEAQPAATPMSVDEAPAQEDIAVMQMTAWPEASPLPDTAPSAGRTHSPVAPSASAQARPAPGRTDVAPPYRVQLAAYRSADEANAGWRRLTAAQPDLLGGFTPVVHRVDLGPDKGVFFRLQTGGFADRQTARTFCRDLQARHIDCLVVRADPGAVPSNASR